MRALRCLLAGMVALGTSRVLPAQSLDTNDRPFLDAAVLVMGHDIMAARCVEQYSIPADGAAKIASWVAENEVERIRVRTRELEQRPDGKKQFDFVRRVMGSRFAAHGQAACRSAVDLTQRSDAQFARIAPTMIAALRARVSTPATSAVVSRETAPVASPSPATPVAVAPAPGTSRAGTIVAPASSSELAARIESFGFDTRTSMGVGGFIGLDVYPVVLFRDGTALTDVEGLGFPGGVEAHRRANAGKWTRWRKAGAEIQLEKKGAWTKLAFTKTYSTLPRDFRLNGRFTRLSGVGNVAYGGTSSVTAVSQYTFLRDGRVLRDGSVGSSSSEGNASVVTSSVAPNMRGHYSIEGITLRIRYDDGREESRILVTDPADPDVIWLDGAGYTSH
jgi:hypothetical protein